MATKRNPLFKTAIGLAVAAAVPRAVLANDSTWTNPAGGSFTDAANWSAGVPVARVPSGASDRGFFDLANSYTVTLPADAAAGTLIQKDGAITADLQGHTLTFDEADLGGFVAGVAPKFTLVNGTLNTHFSNVNAT